MRSALRHRHAPVVPMAKMCSTQGKGALFIGLEVFCGIERITAIMPIMPMMTSVYIRTINKPTIEMSLPTDEGKYSIKSDLCHSNSPLPLYLASPPCFYLYK
ncbi:MULTISPECIES: hypothetical protein [Aeromonas]|uniref:hypothetical protein n=1 Tax=Aeromonas TaxID=642 RepID=UPI0012F17348|nr:hypothetical protein [Aeromonas salmonicida]VXA80648.1 conserved hypothetical protein [Aeromonas salmonicida]